MPIAYPYKFSDWYGYDKDCVGKISFSASIDNNPSSVCSASRNQTYYHNGTSTPGAPINNPVVGNTVYSDIQGQNTLSSGNYGILYNKYIVVNSSGVVTAVTNCLTSFSSGSGQADTKFVCTQSVNTTKYHDGGSTTPTTGDTVYENSSGTTTTANGFYTIQNGASPPATIGYYRITGGSGVVASLGLCFP